LIFFDTTFNYYKPQKANQNKHLMSPRACSETKIITSHRIEKRGIAGNISTCYEDQIPPRPPRVHAFNKPQSSGEGRLSAFSEDFYAAKVGDAFNNYRNFEHLNSYQVSLGKKEIKINRAWYSRR
jgi:hypothetical protein